mmetsp:Transcript_6879/g.15672  ORF Transcript_6879/g.15672 Transcript_6879/m.15672 type:complete len:333 (+) Transcript_6879:316-1314(+)
MCVRSVPYMESWWHWLDLDLGLGKSVQGDDAVHAALLLGGAELQLYLDVEDLALGLPVRLAFGLGLLVVLLGQVRGGGVVAGRGGRRRAAGGGRRSLLWVDASGLSLGDLLLLLLLLLGGRLGLFLGLLGGLLGGLLLELFFLLLGEQAVGGVSLELGLFLLFALLLVGGRVSAGSRDVDAPQPVGDVGLVHQHAVGRSALPLPGPGGDGGERSRGDVPDNSTCHGRAGDGRDHGGPGLCGRVACRFRSIALRAAGASSEVHGGAEVACPVTRKVQLGCGSIDGCGDMSRAIASAIPADGKFCELGFLTSWTEPVRNFFGSQGRAGQCQRQR